MNFQNDKELNENVNDIIDVINNEIYKRIKAGRANEISINNSNHIFLLILYLLMKHIMMVIKA